MENILRQYISVRSFLNNLSQAYQFLLLSIIRGTSYFSLIEPITILFYLFH